ncbi:MAG: dihydrodipicolinate synthase family protein [bacterium]
MTPALIPAAGTPLAPDEGVHLDGFAKQCARFWHAGFNHILIAGTMGAMPLLRDATWQQLIEHAMSVCPESVERFAGAGDTSFARTRDRIAYLNRFPLDGVLVLTPYFMPFSQPDLIRYFQALAEESRAPLYLYDLPQRTGTALEQNTVLTLAKHSNIRGIKCSGPLDDVLALSAAIQEKGIAFRLIIAQPTALGSLVRDGFMQHLDGMYALAPAWSRDLAAAGAAGDVSAIDQRQADLTQLRDILRAHGGMSALTVLMNQCGVPGNFAPQPFTQLDAEERQRLLAEPVVQRFIHNG